MIKCQIVSVGPRKIVSWFLQLVLVTETIEAQLSLLCDNKIDVPSDTIMPTLSKHWEEPTASEEAEDCMFQGLPVIEGWIVTGQKKNVTYKWKPQNPSDCLDDLMTVC